MAQSNSSGIDKTFKCNHCDKTCSRREYLKKHIEAVHEKLKKVNCKLCGKYFYDISRLIVHDKTVHKKEKRFKCLKCDASE